MSKRLGVSKPSSPFFWPRLDNRLTPQQKSNGQLSSISLLRGLSLVLGMTLYSPAWSLDLNQTTPVVESLVQFGLQNNAGLQSQSERVESQLARLESLRARFLPSLGLSARASVAEGGRTIDFPAGDLLNPVYAALNQQAAAQGQAARFPTLQNQSIPLLRSREQDTRLQLSGPLYAPQLSSQIEAQVQTTEAERANSRKLKEELERDIRIAYWQTAQAQSQLDILQNSLITLKENERVNQALYRAGAVTLDAPKRAQAETLDMQVNVQRAQTQLNLAKEYLNTLLNRPASTPVVTPQGLLNAQDIQSRLEQIQPTPLSNTASPRPPAALDALDANLKALEAAKKAAEASYKPTVGYQLDAGYQGMDYRFGPKTGFAQASVVLSWALVDGGTRKSNVRAALAEQRAVEKKRIEVIQQLQLAQSQALQNLEVSLRSVTVRQAQLAAAEESLRISTRKRDAGEIAQIEFLSAESSATRARLGLMNTVYQAQIDEAIWQFHHKQLPALPTTIPAKGDRP